MGSSNWTLLWFLLHVAIPSRRHNPVVSLDSAVPTCCISTTRPRPAEASWLQPTLEVCLLRNLRQERYIQAQRITKEKRKKDGKDKKRKTSTLKGNRKLDKNFSHFTTRILYTETPQNTRSIGKSNSGSQRTHKELDNTRKHVPKSESNKPIYCPHNTLTPITNLIRSKTKT